MPNSFCVVFESLTGSEVIRDIVSEVDYLTLWKMGKGTTGKGPRPVGIYGPNNKQEAINHANRSLY
jgi:hypothetical protein